MKPLKKKFLVIAASVFCTITSIQVFGQRPEQDINLANSLKKKYGDKVHVVCLKSVTTVDFDYTDSKKAVSPASAYESIDESLISLKDNYTFGKTIYYGDYSNIVEIKSWTKNHASDIFSADIAAGDDDVFYSGLHCRAFTIPFSSLGEKERYSADRETSDLKHFTVIPFPDYYPFEEKVVIFNVPKWLNIEFKEMNFDGYDITKTVSEDPKTHNTVYTYTAKNIKNYHSGENNKPNFYATAPHILILAKSFTAPAGGTSTNVFNSMDDVYNFCEKMVKDAGNKDDAVKQLVTQLTQDKKTDLDKIKAIYYWVQDNVRYIAFENGISAWEPAPCQDVYKDKYGDCKGMANLLTVMLKDAGFDARRTWIGVNGIPYDFSTPTLRLFN